MRISLSTVCLVDYIAHSCSWPYFTHRYVEEHVQKTAVAIETQGISLVTSGKRRESLTVSMNLWCSLVCSVSSVMLTTIASLLLKEIC